MYIPYRMYGGMEYCTPPTEHYIHTTYSTYSASYRFPRAGGAAVVPWRGGGVTSVCGGVRGGTAPSARDRVELSPIHLAAVT